MDGVVSGPVQEESNKPKSVKQRVGMSKGVRSALVLFATYIATRGAVVTIPNSIPNSDNLEVELQYGKRYELGGYSVDDYDKAELDLRLAFKNYNYKNNYDGYSDYEKKELLVEVLQYIYDNYPEHQDGISFNERISFFIDNVKNLEYFGLLAEDSQEAQKLLVRNSQGFERNGSKIIVVNFKDETKEVNGETKIQKEGKIRVAGTIAHELSHIGQIGCKVNYEDDLGLTWTDNSKKYFSQMLKEGNSTENGIQALPSDYLKTQKDSIEPINDADQYAEYSIKTSNSYVVFSSIHERLGLECILGSQFMHDWATSNDMDYLKEAKKILNEAHGDGYFEETFQNILNILDKYGEVEENKFLARDIARITGEQCNIYEEETLNIIDDYIKENEGIADNLEKVNSLIEMRAKVEHMISMLDYINSVDEDIEALEINMYEAMEDEIYNISNEEECIRVLNEWHTYLSEYKVNFYKVSLGINGRNNRGIVNRLSEYEDRNKQALLEKLISTNVKFGENGISINDLSEDAGMFLLDKILANDMLDINSLNIEIEGSIATFKFHDKGCSYEFDFDFDENILVNESKVPDKVDDEKEYEEDYIL